MEIKKSFFKIKIWILSHQKLYFNNEVKLKISNHYFSSLITNEKDVCFLYIVYLAISANIIFLIMNLKLDITVYDITYAVGISCKIEVSKCQKQIL